MTKKTYTVPKSKNSRHDLGAVNILGPLKAQKNRLKIVVASDIHAPYHDEEALDVLISFLRRKRPDFLILNGDTLDFVHLSTHATGKDKLDSDDFKAECKAASAIVKLLARAAGSNCKVVFVNGNHESRLDKFIANNTPFAGRKGLSLPEIAYLDEEEITWVGERGCFIRNCLFTHGVRLGISDNAAKKEIEDNFIGTGALDLGYGKFQEFWGFSGHLHRPGSASITIPTLGGFKTGHWRINPCLSTLNPDYMAAKPGGTKWTHGFSYIQSFDDGTVIHKFIKTEGGEWNV